MAGEDPPPSKSTLSSQESHEGVKSTDGSSLVFSKSDFPPLNSNSGNSRKLGHKENWGSLFSVKTPSEDCSLERQSSVLMDLNQGVGLSSKNFENQTQECMNLVLGFFAGRKLPYHMVHEAISKVWKTKSEVNISIHSNNVYVFNFNNEEDRKIALEQGSFEIAGQLFVVRPWSLMLEQSIAQMKTIPVWVLIYNVPLHLWNKLGLSSIATFLGNPLMMDEHTKKKTRLSYARVCVEINIDFSFPSLIPLWIDGVHIMDLPVEYQWKPSKCSNCSSFGHTTSSCSISKGKKKTTQQWILKKTQIHTDVVISEKAANKDNLAENGNIEELPATYEKGNPSKNSTPRENELNIVQDLIIETPMKNGMIESSLIHVPSIKQLTSQAHSVNIMELNKSQKEAAAGENSGIDLTENGDGTWTVYSSKKKKKNSIASSSAGTSSSTIPRSHLSPFLDLDSVSDLVEKNLGLPLISECENEEASSEDSEYETDYESMGGEKLKSIKDIPYRRPLTKDQKVANLSEAVSRFVMPMGASEAEGKAIFEGIIDREPANNQEKSKPEKALEQIKWEGVTNNANYSRGKRTPLKKKMRAITGAYSFAVYLLFVEMVLAFSCCA